MGRKQKAKKTPLKRKIQNERENDEKYCRHHIKLIWTENMLGMKEDSKEKFRCGNSEGNLWGKKDSDDGKEFNFVWWTTQIFEYFIDHLILYLAICFIMETQLKICWSWEIFRDSLIHPSQFLPNKNTII